MIAKLKYGVDFEDGLDGLKKTFVFLLKWFEYDDPSYREEALEALFSIIKVKIVANYLPFVCSNHHLKPYSVSFRFISNKTHRLK